MHGPYTISGISVIPSPTTRQQRDVLFLQHCNQQHWAPFSLFYDMEIRHTNGANTVNLELELIKLNTSFLFFFPSQQSIVLTELKTMKKKLAGNLKMKKKKSTNHICNCSLLLQLLHGNTDVLSGQPSDMISPACTGASPNWLKHLNS